MPLKRSFQICSFPEGLRFNEEVVITSMRHKEALENASDSLLEVKRSLEAGMPEDFFLH